MSTSLGAHRHKGTAQFIRTHTGSCDKEPYCTFFSPQFELKAKVKLLLSPECWPLFASVHFFSTVFYSVTKLTLNLNQRSNPSDQRQHVEGGKPEGQLFSFSFEEESAWFILDLFLRVTLV